MADVCWLLIQVCYILPMKARLYLLCIGLALSLTIIVPSSASEEHLAFLKFESQVKNTDTACNVNKFISPFESSAKTSPFTSHYLNSEDRALAGIVGEFPNAGNSGEAEGLLYKIPDGCADVDNTEGSEAETDDSEFTDLPKDWVGIVHYGRSYGTSENSTERCPSVIDRMKTALMFGASAIIILSLNPKLLKELDLVQMFSKPVVLLRSPENITTVLSILSRKISVKVQITVKSTMEDLQKQTTFTWWTSCGWSIGTVHGRQWAGVVCLDKQEKGTSKADPSSFWNFFYSALLTLMLLFIVKAKRRNGEWGGADQEIELSLRRLAHQALCVMKIKKYRCRQRSPERADMCAICLEYFMPKQKVRVLPCFHEFHTRCVDTWLVKNRTCPLCKQNILGHIDA